MHIEILQQIEGAKQARGLTVIIDVFRAMTVESFVLNQNSESGLNCMERVDIPEAFTLHPNAHLGNFTKEQAAFFPNWLK